MSASREQFGAQRLLDVVARNLDKSAADIVEKVYQAVGNFRTSVQADALNCGTLSTS